MSPISKKSRETLVLPFTFLLTYTHRCSKISMEGGDEASRKRSEVREMSRWYGSVQNRLEENRHLVDEIKVGTGMTEYSWSDCYPYEVVAVKDQKHVTVKAMSHRADKTKAHGMGHQDWIIESDPSAPTMDMVKRGNYWYSAVTVTKDMVDALDDSEESSMVRLSMANAGIDISKVMEAGKQTKYQRMNVSFGKAKYYYDWEF